MCDMGMTDKQFDAFVRFILSDVQEANEEQDIDKKKEKLDKIVAKLQQILED